MASLSVAKVPKSMDCTRCHCTTAADKWARHPTHTRTHVPVCVCECVLQTDITKSACDCNEKMFINSLFMRVECGEWRPREARRERETHSGTQGSVCWKREGTGGGLRKPVSKFHVDNNVRKLNCVLFRAVHSCSCRFRATTLVSFLGRCSFEKEKLFNRPPSLPCLSFP